MEEEKADRRESILFVSSTTRYLIGSMLIFWLLMFALTHLPLDPSSQRVSLAGWDKVAHIVLFFVLTNLLLFATHYFRQFNLWSISSMFLLVATYAAIDELSQAFVPGRTPDFHDWLADLGGIILGMVFFMALYFTIELKRVKKDG